MFSPRCDAYNIVNIGRAELIKIVYVRVCVSVNVYFDLLAKFTYKNATTETELQKKNKQILNHKKYSFK